MCFHSIEQGCILRRWDTLWVFFEEKSLYYDTHCQYSCCRLPVSKLEHPPSHPSHPSHQKMCFHSIEQGCILRRCDALWVFFEEKRVCVMRLQHWAAPRGADPVCHSEQLTQICWLICGLPSMHQIGMKIVSINCLPISGQTQRRESDWSIHWARSNFSMPQTRICLRIISICSSLLWSTCL